MPPALRQPLAGAACAFLAAAAACDRTSQPASRDSAAPPVTASTDTGSSPPPVRSGWDPADGAVLLVSEDSAHEASVIFPQLMDDARVDASLDTAVAAATPLDLFGPPGRAGAAELGEGITLGEAAPDTSEAACWYWPTVPLRRGGQGAAAWRVAFVRGRASPIPLDSIQALAGGDSAALAAAAVRMASTLPGDTVPAFRGLPFAVRTIRRFTSAPGVEGLVAELVRTINQEARAAEQHTFLVAERPSTDPATRWTPSYFERTDGTEETVPTMEVLAAVVLGPDRKPTLVLRRDFYEGSQFVLLERAAPGRWRVRWTSAYAGC